MAKMKLFQYLLHTYSEAEMRTGKKKALVQTPAPQFNSSHYPSFTRLSLNSWKDNKSSEN